jgi:hypothetical protein
MKACWAKTADGARGLLGRAVRLVIPGPTLDARTTEASLKSRAMDVEAARRLVIRARGLAGSGAKATSRPRRDAAAVWSAHRPREGDSDDQHT